MFILLIKGIIVGIAIAAPVGPIGLLCIQRSLRYGYKAGLMTGMGAATADGLYGLVAGFGLTTISSALISYQFWIRIIGGLFLIYLGIKLFFSKAEHGQIKAHKDKSLWSTYATTIFLTLTNPVTIISFMAIFAGLGLGSRHNDHLQAASLVLGVFIGSTLWWVVLCSFTQALSHRISGKHRLLINWVSGAVMLVFGLISLKSVL